MEADSTPRVASSPARRIRRGGSLLVVLVDPDESSCREMARALRDASHDVEVWNDGSSALAALADARPEPVDAVVCAVREGAPGTLTGTELCAALQVRFGLLAPPVILVTAEPEAERANLGGRVGAWHVLATPIGSSDLVDVVERAARMPLGSDVRLRPEKLGPWRITGELGRGGMGVVYRARRNGEGPEAALKVYASMEEGEDPEGLLRFRRELELIASLDHPGVPRFLDQGVDRGALYYVMALAPGEPLSRRLRERGPLAVAQGTRTAREIAGTLAYLHGKKIVHRDVKPTNVVIDEGRHAMLVDFGLAKRRHDPSLTASTSVMGTPLYLAPEVIDTGKASFASDVFSLGIATFESLIGMHPLTIGAWPKQAEIHDAYAKRLLPPLRKLVPGASEDLARAIEWSLHPDPRERPTAAQLAEQLAKA